MENLPQWYALYTRSRFELKSASLLHSKNIEAYVPVRRVVKQWSDRKKLIDEPVIPSYVFVRILPEQYNQVLDTDGIVRYVFFCGKPAIIPDNQIHVLKAVMGADVEVDCVSGILHPGTQVRVNAGPLCGLEGELIRVAGKHKVIVRLESMQQALMITLSPSLLEPSRQNRQNLALA